MSDTKERVPATLKHSPAAWSSAGLHRAQLESGTWVRFRFPDLSMLAGAGKVPEHLLATALARIAKELKLLMEPGVELPPEAEATIDHERLALNTELNHWLLTQMIHAVSEDGEHFVDVELTLEQAEAIPAEDKILLFDLAERLRDTDARGVVMGVTPIARFVRFLQAHRRHGLCGPDCPGCADLTNEARTLETVLGVV